MSFAKLKDCMGILVTFLISSFSGAGCFTSHLDEAIVLNTERLPLYSKLTDGKSEVVSNTLIKYEKLSKAPGMYLDFRAKKFQKKGIPILCEDFVPIKLVPGFKSFEKPYPESAPQYPLDLERVVRDLRAAGDFETVASLAIDHIETLSKFPTYFCMTRHVLESIARSARLAPGFVLKDAGVEGLAWKNIYLQFRGLSLSKRLDEMALPIQEMGVPILCNDVPLIPIP